MESPPPLRLYVWHLIGGLISLAYTTCVRQMLGMRGLRFGTGALLLSPSPILSLRVGDCFPQIRRINMFSDARKRGSLVGLSHAIRAGVCVWMHVGGWWG